VVEGACTSITSFVNSSSTLYLKISNCSMGEFSVHRQSDCSDTVDSNGGQLDSCSTIAPYFSFAIYADAAVSTPYCAQGANGTCPFTLIAYNNQACTEFLRCTVRTGNSDGVCVYEQRLGLYLLPHCQTGSLIVSTQPTCSSGLTRSFQNVSITDQLVTPTCSPFGNNATSTSLIQFFSSSFLKEKNKIYLLLLCFAVVI
jgi:hypothetical protein